MLGTHQPQKKLLSPVWSHLSDLVVERAAGSLVYTTCGKTLLDFSCGIGVTNTGHCHPRVVKAAQDQIGKLIHGQINIVYHKPVLELVEELQKVVPAGLDQFFLSNSGAEAIEASIKLSRHATGKTNIITFQGSFHGRTIGTMSLTQSKTIYKERYGPLMAGVHVAPYAYCHRCPMNGCRKSDEDCCNYPLDEVRKMLKQQTAPNETAAIILEPVLGEGGYVMAPKPFMKGLRQICDEHNILLIVDEIQTGFGRTGKYFGIQHYDVTPDILVFAKGVASGFPLSGIAANSKLHKTWKTGSHGGTYGPNAVSCAAGVATQRVLQEEGLIENAVVRGKQLTAALNDMKKRYPVIADVRGPGLMIGLEFHDRKQPGDNGVKPGFANALSKKCVEHGMLLLNTSIFETIRFIPPLTVTEKEIDTGVEIFEKSLKDTLREYNTSV